MESLHSYTQLQGPYYIVLGVQLLGYHVNYKNSGKAFKFQINKHTRTVIHSIQH